MCDTENVYNNNDTIMLSQFIGTNIHYKHYSNDKFLKATISEVNDNTTLIMTPSDPYIICGYFEDDPIAIILELNEQVITCQTYITKIDYIAGNLEVLVRQTNDFSNRRQQTRYPTSLYATILGSYEMENTFINNISSDGLSLLSNAPLKIDDEIEIETTFKKVNIYFKAKVIWIRELSTIYEYGLTTLGSDPEINKIINLVSKFS